MKSIHIKKNYIISICISILILVVFLFSTFIFYFSKKHLQSIEVTADTKGDYIKWVDFTVPCNILKLTSEIDINSNNNKDEITYNWI